MRYRTRSDERRSVARGLIVLLVVVLVGAELTMVVWPRVRQLLHGTLLGDDPNAGPPIVCRTGNVLAGVYNPGRLAVQSSCTTAFGRVTSIVHAPDGDIHISLLPDRGYWHLLDSYNYAIGGSLVVEVVPTDQPTVTIPSFGTHIRVTGAYVTDTEHGWREIHPAWQIVPMP